MKKIFFIIAFVTGTFAHDPVRVLVSAQVHPVCLVSVNLNDSLGKPYCFLCKTDSSTVRVKMLRDVSTKELHDADEMARGLLK